MLRLTPILEGYKEIDELERLADLCIRHIIKLNIPRFEAVYNWRKTKGLPTVYLPSDDSFSQIIQGNLHFSNPSVKLSDVARKGKWDVIGKFLKDWSVRVTFSDKPSTLGLYGSNPTAGSDIYIKLNYKPFSDILSHNIDHDLRNKWSGDKSKIEKTALLSMGAIFRSALLHELQHAYDDWRSSGKYTQTKPMASYTKQYGGGDYLSGGDVVFSPEQLGKYYALPHEYWARFSEAVREIFSFSDNFRKPFADIIKKFKREFRGYDSVPEAGQRRLWKALYKYYKEKGEPKIK